MSSPRRPPPPEPRSEELAAARRGDEQAYRALVEPYRRELHAHCYRMLGSVHDAEDALQDALVRAWRGLPGFEGRSTVRTWLYRIATNACLAMIERRSRRGLPVDLGPAADPLDPGWRTVESGMIEPYPDEQLGLDAGYAAPAARVEQREGVELAFIVALQHLAPTQRAVLILRDVLAFSAKETAEALDTTVASVTSALQRARKAVARRLPDRSQQANLQALGDARLQRLVDRYVAAWERGDAEAIVALLAEDATFAMPPYEAWYRGRDAIAEFLRRGPLTEAWRHRRVRANGQPALGCYRWDGGAGCYVANSVDVLTIEGDQVAQVTAFLDATGLAGFGLPDRLPADARARERDRGRHRVE
jgi:RNA polymerase sigma-70 factor (ECF subfamily)